jgi:hypothetical protein
MLPTPWTSGSHSNSKAFRLVVLACLLAGSVLLSQVAQGQGKKPNILVIFGDDIGQANISRYTHGLWAI